MNMKIGPPISKRGMEGGFILIVALVMLSVLAVLSLEYSQLARNAAARTRTGEDGLSGFYAAESGIERVKARLGADTGSPDTLFESWNDWSACADTIGGWGVGVRVTDEAGKININQATAPVLLELFKQFGMKTEERSVLVASIQDWIDTGELHRMNGAESDYYQSNGYPHGAKNAPLDSLEEILRIRGVPADLFERKAGYGNSTYSFSESATVIGDTRVNINTAPPLVLLAMGLTPAEVNSIMEKRSTAAWSSLDGLSSLLGPSRYDVFRPQWTLTSSWFLVESTASRSGSMSVSVYALLRRVSRQIYVWEFWS